MEIWDIIRILQYTKKINIMKITKNNLNNFRTDFYEAMVSLKRKYDVSINMGNIKFDDASFDTKITIKNNQVNGVDFEQHEFEQYAEIMGFKKSDYKLKLSMDNKVFELIGFKPQSPKNNCKIRDIKNGKTYTTNSNVVVVNARKNLTQ